jgi:hypothetical protein
LYTEKQYCARKASGVNMSDAAGGAGRDYDTECPGHGADRLKTKHPELAAATVVNHSNASNRMASTNIGHLTAATRRAPISTVAASYNATRCISISIPHLGAEGPGDEI